MPDIDWESTKPISMYLPEPEGKVSRLLPYYDPNSPAFTSLNAGGNPDVLKADGWVILFQDLGSAAARARRRDPHADITIVERGRLLSYAGCGMPYYIQGQVRDFHELMSTPVGVIRDGTFFQNVKDIRVLNQTLAETTDFGADSKHGL